MAFELDVENAVRARYGAAASAKENALCCPVEYDPPFLKILPAEITDAATRRNL